MTKTSEDYTPVIYLEPGKPPRRRNVLVARLHSIAAARERLALDKPAWVRAEDVTAVTGAASGVDG